MLPCALVWRDGSFAWRCLPRFDSDACFAALLGTHENGFWRIAPAGGQAAVSRRSRPGTTIPETTFEPAEGAVTLIHLQPLARDEDHANVALIAACDPARVRMHRAFILRCGFGRTHSCP